MSINRGLGFVNMYFDGFLATVKQKLTEKGSLSVLEAGCGLGQAMMGLVKLCGSSVKAVGFNLNPGHGNKDRMVEEALSQKIFSAQEIDSLPNMPEILYLDANQSLPFEDNSFDLIYSCAMLYLLEEKVAFIEECNRVLKKGGVAFIQTYFTWENNDGWAPNDPEYLTGWQIWKEGRRIPLNDFISSIPGVKVGYVVNTPGFIKLVKQPTLDFGLRLVAAINTGHLCSEWMGVKSIYTSLLETKSLWQSGETLYSKSLLDKIARQSEGSLE